MNDTEPSQVRTSLGRNLTHGMLDALGRAIVTGHYDGRRFPTEADLTTQHGVSRSVTREAVKMLTAKGLLSARPRQGTIVQPTSAWNLFDTDVLRWLLERKFTLPLLRSFNELRLAIEPMAAQLAAAHATPAGKATIAAGYARMEEAERGDEDALEADIAFHVAILRAGDNMFFAQFEELVSTALRTSIRFTNRFKGRSASLPAHKAVLEAIEAGDEHLAGAAVRQIIEDVMVLIRQAESAGAAADRANALDI
ncbi:FadR/GntR family transcriptional regulator [Sphingomonas sp. HMP9]|uniref:FadR/GntR family transcriptional regulator n=1 Tax=Sphingomonas sp. HMP9 TaxID=1517554 RepID=UPI0015971322|nr:FCD domain-containing protein [Sphingomonas sp. HMP9]